MRSARHWLVVVTAASLTLAQPAATQVLDPIQYSLYTASDLAYGCSGPCACPYVFTGPLGGTFTFYRTGIDLLYTHYALLNIVWHYPVPGTGKVATITGHGTYDLGGEVAILQRMQLDVVTDGVLEQHFDSGLVPARGIFPAIDIEVRTAVNVCIDSVLHVVTGPQGTESVPPGGSSVHLSASPNPTRAGADVLLSLPEAEAGEITVLNVAGQRVAVLARGTFAAGENRWHWDGRTSSGADAGAGVFWIRARVGGDIVTQRFARLR
jgi:hypothetical protein